MITLSILTKTYAWVLGAEHPWLGIALWLVGLVMDVWVFGLRGIGEWRPARTGLRWLIDLTVAQASFLIMGWAVATAMDYAAVRWKDGLPGMAVLTAGLLQAFGVPVAVGQGQLSLTTMAGPLSFLPSIDHLGLHLPALLLGFAAVALLLSRPTLAEAGRALLLLALLLVGVAVMRFVLGVGGMLALCDFVGYETEELPVSPLLRPNAIALFYLPLLLVVSPLIQRLLRAAKPSTEPIGEETQAWPLKPWMWALAGAASLALFALATWEFQGNVKQGTVLICTYHTQWSRTDRPYDREWYGADSGYNYACLKRWLGVFYSVRELKTRIRATDLQGVSVLVIYVPDKALTEEERRVIAEFVRQGGGLLVIGDHTNVFGSSSHLNEVCAPFGFQFRDDVLFDLDEDFFQLLDIPRRAPAVLHGIPFFKFRGPASIRPTSFFTRSLMTIGHSKALRAIYSVNNFYPPPHDRPGMQTGTFAVSVSSRFGRGRVVAFADSTVFSNFEIFYPGKYEYLVNAVNWLNHADGPMTTFAQRCALLAAWLGLLYGLWRWHRPKAWLQLGLAFVLGWGAARLLVLSVESSRATFPEPTRPARMLFFAAGSHDPVYALRAFTSDAPLDRRFDVFIQWVLRTGAFSAFYVLDEPRREGLFEHMSHSSKTTTGLALIVQDASGLSQLERLAQGPAKTCQHALLMFSKQLNWEQVETGLRRGGWVTASNLLARARAAWPSGEVLCNDNGRRVLLVFDAQRFSDKEMGYTEKVVPNAAQRKRFDEAFRLVDMLFATDEATSGAPGAATPTSGDTSNE